MSELIAAAADPGINLTGIAGVLALIGVVVTGIFLIVNRRGGDRARRTDLIPPTWPEINARMDLQDKKIRLLSGLISGAAAQWPPDSPPPKFDRETMALIKELDDTLVPSQWRAVKNQRPRPRTAQ